MGSSRVVVSGDMRMLGSKSIGQRIDGGGRSLLLAACCWSKDPVKDAFSNACLTTRRPLFFQKCALRRGGEHAVGRDALSCYGCGWEAGPEEKALPVEGSGFDSRRRTLITEDG